MAVPTPVETDRSGAPGRRFGGVLLRVVGAALALVGGFATALLTVLLVPLRVAGIAPAPLDMVEPAASLAAHPEIGAWRVPLAVVVAVGGAWFFVWFVRAAVGWRGAPALPALGWFTVVLAALGTSDAGDRLLMPDDWVATIALFGGTVVFVVGFVTSLVPMERRAARPPSNRAGSR